MVGIESTLRDLASIRNTILITVGSSLRDFAGINQAIPVAVGLAGIGNSIDIAVLLLARSNLDSIKNPIGIAVTSTVCAEGV